MKSALLGTVPFLLMVSAIAFGLGIILPMVRFDTLYFFSETPSLVELIAGLWLDGSQPVAAAVCVFSLLFPLLKLYVVFAAAFQLRPQPMPAWTMHLAKWSMMDVLIVALVIYAAKTSGLASAAAQPGIWFYALSAVSVSLAAAVVNARGAEG